MKKNKTPINISCAVITVVIMVLVVVFINGCRFHSRVWRVIQDDFI